MSIGARLGPTPQDSTLDEREAELTASMLERSAVWAAAKAVETREIQARAFMASLAK